MWGTTPWVGYACAPWRLVPDLLGSLLDEVLVWTGTPPRWLLPFFLGALVGAGGALLLAC